MDPILLIADTFNHEYQSRSSQESAEVLASLLTRMAACLPNDGTRQAFTDIATMSGLDA